MKTTTGMQTKMGLSSVCLQSTLKLHASSEVTNQEIIHGRNERKTPSQ